MAAGPASAADAVTVSRPVTFDTVVQSAYATDQSSADQLRLGHLDDGVTAANTARPYLRVDTSGLAGAQVSSARLRLWGAHSWSCQQTGWEAWRTERADSATRWASQPAILEKIGVSTETKGYGTLCAAGYVSIDITKAYQIAAARGAAEATVMLRGAGETSSTSWKRFDSSEGTHPPVVTVTYTAA